MLQFRSKLLLFFAASMLLAQSSSRSMETDMRRVGSRLACQCGCAHTVATCDMFECHFSKPAKQRIMQLQQSGMADQAIVDLFVKENGPGILRARPSVWGRLIPYLVLIPGLLMIYWFVRRYYRQPATASGPPVIDDPDYKRYREQIDKDLARLE
jgi:cytochrome c-type biogenesis protein CcmH/NrfF